MPLPAAGGWQVKDSDLYVRAIDTGKEIRLTSNGTARNAYQMLSWAPDSKMLVGCRVEPGEQKRVYEVESSPPGGGRARLRSHVYPLPGDKLPSLRALAIRDSQR